MSAVIARKGIAMFVGSTIAGKAFLKASQRIVSLFFSRSTSSGGTLIGLVLAVAFLVCLSAPSEATRVKRLSLSQLSERADSVILGRVLAISTHVGPEGKMVWTDYDIMVEETLAGTPKSGVTRVSFAGGKSGNLSIGIVGVPKLEQGQRYVLFLFPPGPLASAAVGWGQGIFNVVETTVGSSARTVLVSYDREPLQLDSSGMLMRGSPINVGESGRLTVPSAQESPRAPEPQVYDANGKPVSQPPQQPAQVAAQISERNFATLDDLREFLSVERR